MIKQKNIIAGLLLFLVVAPILVFAMFFISQKITQYEMEEKLEKASLQTITLSTKDFVWIKMGKEIIIGNEMFDVKSYEAIDNKIIFTGLYDKIEDQINNQINHLLNNKKTDKHSNGIRVLKLSQTVCIISNFYNLPTIFFPLHKKEYCFFNEKAISAVKSITSPPPVL